MHSRTIPSALLLTAAAVFGFGGTQPSYEWTPASGSPPPAGYEVWISRGGGAYVLEGDTATPTVTINCSLSSQVEIKVRAFSAGKAELGPFSPPSDPIVCLEPLRCAG